MLAASDTSISSLNPGAFCDTCCIDKRQKSCVVQSLWQHTSPRSTALREHAATHKKNGEASRERCLLLLAAATARRPTPIRLNALRGGADDFDERVGAAFVAAAQASESETARRRNPSTRAR